MLALGALSWACDIFCVSFVRWCFEALGTPSEKEHFDNAFLNRAVFGVREIFASCTNIQISRFYEHLKKFREIYFAHIFAKFEYFAKVIIYSKSPDHVL